MQASDISEVHMTCGSWNKVRAYSTITFSNGMKINGFKIIEGPKGLFVGVPSIQRKDKETGQMKWENIIFLPEKEDYASFQKLILQEYDKQNATPSSGGSYQDQNQAPAENSSGDEEKPWWD